MSRQNSIFVEALLSPPIFWSIPTCDRLSWDVAAMLVDNKTNPLMPMGVLAPGSAHARPSTQPPIDVSEIFPARVSAESPSNISPNPSEVICKVLEP